jgi:hypothetical protein
MRKSHNGAAKRSARGRQGEDENRFQKLRTGKEEEIGKAGSVEGTGPKVKSWRLTHGPFSAIDV